jgi:hypothetical protein
LIERAEELPITFAPGFGGLPAEALNRETTRIATFARRFGDTSLLSEPGSIQSEWCRRRELNVSSISGTCGKTLSLYGLQKPLPHLVTSQNAQKAFFLSGTVSNFFARTILTSAIFFNILKDSPACERSND